MNGKKIGALATAAAILLTGCGSNGDGSADDKSSDQVASSPKAGCAGGEVGVFTWWADGSEKKGLDALEKSFKKQYPNDTFVNLAVAGGSGSNAKAKLASDLQNGNPPGSFQGHAGAELTDYIDNEQIEPVDDLIKELGGDSVLPKTLLDRLTVDGHIYSGVATPLSIGGTWTQTELFESILMANLGADGYSALFTKDGNWGSPEVKASIEDFKKALSFANTASDGDDWPAATDMVSDGSAAYNIMGDWAVAEFDSRNKTFGKDYTAFALPGKEDVYGFLADSFTLPTGTKNPEATKDWLRFVGSKDAQSTFNQIKGSIPARTDVSPDGFNAYQQKAMKDFKEKKIVSSIAHGAAVPLAWSSEINTAMSKFHQDKNTDNFVSALVAAHDKYAV